MPKSESNAKQFFDQSKRNALSKLDKSPKGSLDVPIASLVYGLNRHPDFVTTSCCSGRIVLFASKAPCGHHFFRSNENERRTVFFRSKDKERRTAL